MNRRDFTAATAAALAASMLPVRALALGQKTRFTLGRLTYPGEWNARPNAARRVLAEVARATSVDCAEAPDDVAPDDAAIFDHPFLYLSGAGDFPSLSSKARDVLGRYIRYGGFLLVDGAAGDADSAFDAGFRREVAQLIPEAKLEKLDEDHSVFRSFFLINHVCGRTIARPYLEGVTLGDWTPIIYTANDLGGALERDPFGNYRLEATPGGDEQRSWAQRLAVNLVLYALTVNYKKDQIHVEAILRRRRR